MTRDFGHPDVVHDPRAIALFDDLAKRVVSPRPMRACDDPDQWDWRAFLAERRAAMG